MGYRLAADALLFLHWMIVAFVVLGLVFTLAGGLLGWHSARNPWFRGAHVAAISVVAAQAWLGVICPLTTWEMALRDRAGEATYAGAFIAHWLHELLYVTAPGWMFVVAYTVFGLLVLAAWWLVPPAFGPRRGRTG
jgi:hypothetical protein